MGYSSSLNDVHALQQENSQLHSLVAQLMPNNKVFKYFLNYRFLDSVLLIDFFQELVAQNERNQLEMHAQATTLQEQRNHIRILDQALHNAQAKVLQLEQDVSYLNF